MEKHLYAPAPKNRHTPAQPTRIQEGLTKREECAMRFMESLLVNSDKEDTNITFLIDTAIVLADELFDELEKDNG